MLRFNVNGPMSSVEMSMQAHREVYRGPYSFKMLPKEVVAENLTFSQFHPWNARVTASLDTVRFTSFLQEMSCWVGALLLSLWE